MTGVSALVALLIASQAGAVEIRQPERAMSMVTLWKEAGIGPDLDGVEPIDRSESAICGALKIETRSPVRHYSIFTGDMNNDGEDDFTVVQRCVDGTKRDIVLGFAQRAKNGWMWKSFDGILADSKVLLSQIPTQIDPIEFPRKMNTGDWVIPFLTESWFLKEGRLTVYRPDQLKRSTEK